MPARLCWHRRLARLAATAIVAVTLCGCPALWSVMPKLAAGAGWLGSLLDVAAAGTEAYYARHPAPHDDTTTALRHARDALAALHAAIVAATGPEDPDLLRARQEALASYERLRLLLLDSGVLEGRVPPGGAEGDAPLPEPMYLPPAAEVGMAL